jgi:hypothetical protein
MAEVEESLEYVAYAIGMLIVGLFPLPRRSLLR